MEISRVAPFPLTFTADGLTASTDYVVAIMNAYTDDLTEIAVTSDVNGAISTPIPDYYSRYDAEYLVEIYEDLGLDVDSNHIRGDLAWTDTLGIKRPYVDVTTLADTEEEQAEYAQYESLARAIIDSYTDGFYYTRSTFFANGLDNDYIVLPARLNKIIRVWENDILVFDAEPTDVNWTNIIDYYITVDKAAITQNVPNYYGYNKLQSTPPRMREAVSDSFTRYSSGDWPTHEYPEYGSPEFTKGYDYVITVDTGWPIIPQNIKQAATLLINDLKCNTIPYTNAYVKEVKTDQYELKFGDGAFTGTGNAVVDSILSMYPRNIRGIGVL